MTLFFKSKTQEIPSQAPVMVRTVQLLRRDGYCPIKLSYYQKK